MRVRRILAWCFAVSLFCTSGILLFRELPCRVAIGYSIGPIDPRFPISRDRFAAEARAAAALWEQAAGRRLFREIGTGGMVISAVYDTRQEARQTLDRINADLQQRKQSFQELERAYAAKRSAYDHLDAQYTILRVRYEAALAVYSNHTESLRAGAAKPEDLARLDVERRNVNDAVRKLEEMRPQVNAAAMEVNAIVDRLRQVAADEEQVAQRYQDVESTVGDEFEAGVFERRLGVRTITVFSISGEEQLARLLTHEMGHALGIGHLDDPSAVMFRINESGPVTLAPADVSAVVERCALRNAGKRVMENIQIVMDWVRGTQAKQVH